MNTVWVNLEWSHLVREHFGERLTYFFVRKTPYDPREMAGQIEAILKTQKLAGLQGEEIFGAHHVVLRVFLHANLEGNFRNALVSAVRPDDIQEFSVRKIFKSYGREDDDRYYF